MLSLDTPEMRTRVSEPKDVAWLGWLVSIKREQARLVTKFLRRRAVEWNRPWTDEGFRFVDALRQLNRRGA